METVVVIIAMILAHIGMIGSFVPVLPGPPLAWVGMLLVYFWGGTDKAGANMPLSLLLIMLGVTIVVTVIDYLIPGWFTKFTGGSKWAKRGAIVGLFLGLFFPLPFGMIGCSVVGSFLAEWLIAQKASTTALKSAFGAFIGFMAGSGIKFISCAVMLCYIAKYL